MKITFYDKSGKKVKETELSNDVFWATPHVGLMHRLLVLQRANGRYNLAKVLTKWEVSWGWKKPYRQKGTGRARQWSSVNPHYIWWWVAHGPRWNRNFSLSMPKKMRRLALFSYLSHKVASGKVFWLDKYDWEPKTKDFVKMLEVLPSERWVLFVLADKDVNILNASRNVPNVKVLLVNYLNPVDLSTYSNVCFVWEALERLNKVFLSDNE